MTSDRPFRRFVSVDHITQLLAFLALSTALVVGVRFGTLAIASPESNCVIGQARMLLDDQRWLPSPLPGQRFPAALAGMFAPPGFVALADGSNSSVPGCPAGLSLAMSGAMRVGGDAAAFLLVPLFGVLAVWSTFLLGRTLAGPWAGVAGAALLVCSPLFLYGLIQPISDVPAAALWMASLAAALRPGDGSDAFKFKRAISTGLLAGLAIMVRPHLVPLAVAPMMLVWPGPSANRYGKREAAIGGPRLVAATVMGMLPSVGAVAWLQWRMHSSIFGSASTVADSIVGLGQAASNAMALPWWLGVLHTPVLALALLAPLVLNNDNQSHNDNQSRIDYSRIDLRNQSGIDCFGCSSRGAWVLLGFVVAVWILEAPYGSVTKWQQARAMLPALPLLIVLAVAVALSLVSLLGQTTPVLGATQDTGVAPTQARTGLLRDVRRPIVLVVMAAMVGGWWAYNANEHGIFRAKTIERKYREVGRYAATRMPADAVVLAVLPAGSIRHYADVPTLTWSAIPGDQLDALFDDLLRRGYSPLVAIDVSERAAFKTTFAGHSPLADLAWPARITIGRDISVYDPADRTRHVAGEKIPTESISWPVK